VPVLLPSAFARRGGNGGHPRTVGRLHQRLDRLDAAQRDAAAPLQPAHDGALDAGVQREAGGQLAQPAGRHQGVGDLVGRAEQDAQVGVARERHALVFVGACLCGVRGCATVRV
jgi:hypothetical protein